MASSQTKETDIRHKTQDSRRKTQDTRVRTGNGSLLSHILCLVSIVFPFFAVGCGSAWHGRIVHLEAGKVVIQPEKGRIEQASLEKRLVTGADAPVSGSKLLIYRQKTITHPVTDEVLGTIKDNITEVPVLWVRGLTVTATADEPWFSMMRLDDQASSVRGSVKPLTGSVDAVGRIGKLDAEAKSVEIAVTSGGTIAAGSALSVIRYAGMVTDPDTGDLLAVTVEPVADLREIETDADRRLRASYDLMDEKLGWIEEGDVVVERTGDMLSERLWFQDPPDGFSETWILSRNYLHATRLYASGNYREAILELNEVVEMDPGYSDAAYLLGLCYSNLNRYHEAATRFNAILERRPDDAKTWTALAYAHLKQEKLQEAAEAYEKLVLLIPDDPKIWTDLGDIYGMLDDHEKAERAYGKALEIDKDDEEAQYELELGEASSTDQRESSVR